MDLKEFKFTEKHEWARVEGGIAVIGISDFAQSELGDVVYVELPNEGDEIAKGDACSNIESVKAVSDIYSPVSGEIVEVNNALEDSPETINHDCYGEGWILKVKMNDESELDELMDDAAYEEYVKGLHEDK